MFNIVLIKKVVFVPLKGNRASLFNSQHKNIVYEMNIYTTYHIKYNTLEI